VNVYGACSGSAPLGSDWPQRIPVRIQLTHILSAMLISAGMTCTVVIKEGAGPQLELASRGS